MNTKEHMYLKLMEECAEVQQRVSKLLQFGPEESQSTAPTNLRADVTDGTNRERLQAEINDLVAVIILLDYSLPNRVTVEAKARKIEKYLRYSKSLGTVADDPAREVPDVQH